MASGTKSEWVVGLSSGYGSLNGTEILSSQQGLVVGIAIGDVPELDVAANAATMAAAPSMKVALEALVYAITHLSPEAEDGSHTCRISREDLALARDAIARATPSP